MKHLHWTLTVNETDGVLIVQNLSSAVPDMTTVQLTRAQAQALETEFAETIARVKAEPPAETDWQREARLFCENFDRIHGEVVAGLNRCREQMDTVKRIAEGREP